jgi:hypothetical protein
MKSPGWGNTAVGSDKRVAMNKCACVSDCNIAPGGMQTHSVEKVSEKVSGNTFINEGRQHGAMLYVTQYCYGCL